MHSPRRFAPVLLLTVFLGSSAFLPAQVSPAALTAPALAGKTLQLTIEGGEAPFVTSGSYTISLSASGNLYAQPAAGAVTATAGSWSHAPALPIADAVLTLGNYFSDGAPATLSLLDSGFFELNRANLQSHQYGHFTLIPNAGTIPGTPPTISTQPASQTAELGAPVSFTVAASASGGGTTLAYQWRKNGVEIAGATSPTFTLSSAAAADQASYSVVVSTSAGATVSSAATLSIIPHAPIITSQPLTISAYTGGIATFSVTATGFPEPTYQWQYNGGNLAGATGASFTRNPVNNSQGGNYTVIVTNSQGSVTSSAAVLTVANPPGNLENNFRNGAAHNGGVTSLLNLPDGKLLVGGGFNLVDFTTRRGLYLVNADGTIDTSFNADLPANPAISRVVAAPGGKIYILGLFNTVGTTTQRYIARLNANGSLDTTFAGLASNSFAFNDLAVQADGKVVIAGAFSTVNGVNRSKIARLNTDGSLDTTFNATGKIISDDINTLAIGPDGRIYFGGKFLTVHGASRPWIAALTTDGELDPTFDPGAGFDAEIKTLLFQPDGKLLVGGNHTSYNGHASKCLTRLFTDGTWDSTFVPTPLTATTAAGVYSLALQANGKIVVGGAFAKVNNVTRQSITRLLPDGAVDPVFDVGVGTGVTNPFVYAIAIQPNGGIVIGGNFTTVAGISRDKLARLTGDSPTPRAPAIVTQPIAQTVKAGDPVTLTVLADGSPLAYQWRKNGVDILGAIFPSYSLQAATAANAASYSVRISNPSGAVVSSAVALTVDSTFVAGKLNESFVLTNPALASINSLFQQTDGKILLGGPYNAGAITGLTRLTANGLRDTSYTVKTVGSVYTFAPALDGKILIGGQFDSIGGVNQKNIARLNANGTVDTGFSYFNNYTSPILAAAVQPDGKILIGGTNILVRVNADGSDDATFVTSGSPAGQISRIIVQPSGKIIVAGNFSTIRSQSRTNFARLNSDGTLDTSFPTSFGFTPTGVVETQSTGKLLLASNNSGRLYRLSADGVPDETFNSQIDNTGYFSKLLVLSGDRIFGVKTFAGTADGGPPSRFRRFDANGTPDTGFLSEPGANGLVNSLAVTANGRVLLGGTFTVLNSKTRPGGFGALDVENPLVPVFSLQPLSRTALPGASTTFTAAASGLSAYQWQRNGVDLAGQNSATLTINPVSPSVTGSYTVTATNSEGSSTSSAATLAIAHPPVITAQPVSLNSPLGSNVTFSVSATSSVTPLSYQWRKNGTPMPGYTAPSFVLGGITSADAASYDVIVSNADGPVTSNIATLTIGQGGVANFITSFGLDPLTNGALSADPDGDGLTNLFEYIAGGNPTTIDGHTAPQTATSAGSPPVFSYSFDRKHDAAALGLVIQYSENLAVWNEAVNGQNGITISSTPVNAQTDRVTVSFPAGSGKRFVHLSVP